MKFLIKYILESLCIGSFLYLVSIALFGGNDEVSKAIIGVWIACILIGASGLIYHTELPRILQYIVQFSVGIIAFVTLSLYLGWYPFSPLSIGMYAIIIFLIMLGVKIIYYLLAVSNSKKINDVLKHRNKNSI